MNSTQLKLLGLLSMLIDHIGAVLFPQITVLRILGRLSFPIFCFFVAQGFRHTSNRKKYILRLSLFSVVSEIPFDYALKGQLFDWKAQNVFFTLLTGLCALCLLEKYMDRYPLLGLAGVGALSVSAQLLHMDYGWYGVILIVLFYICEKNNAVLSLSFVLLNTGFSILSYSKTQPYAAAAILPLLLYNGKKGTYSLKYLFYLFYPAHLLVLAALRPLILPS